MKKITMIMLAMLLMSGVSYGAVSDDVYVRKDVYEIQMQGMNTKLDMILEEMRAQREEHKAQMKELRDEMNGLREDVKVQVKELRDEMNGLREDVKVQVKELKDEMSLIRAEQEAQRKNINEVVRVVSVLSERLDLKFDTLSARIDGLDKRMDNQQNYLYLVLVIMGIIVALPTVQKMLQWREDRKEARRNFTTIEDVIRLIEQNNARMAGNIQA